MSAATEGQPNADAEHEDCDVPDGVVTAYKPSYSVSTGDGEESKSERSDEVPHSKLPVSHVGSSRDDGRSHEDR